MTLATDLAAALDPARYAEAVGFQPDAWQIEALRSTGDVLMNCSRQSGKSTVAGILAAHAAQYVPDELVLVLSPSLRQSRELYRKVQDAYQRAPVVPAKAETKLTLDLGNGSRIVSLPGKEQTIRSFSGVGLLIIDEAARVPDDLYLAVRPMLAVSGGRILALSTPFGKRGWWFDAYENGGDAWQRFEVPASMCPRISPAFLAQEKRIVGEWWYAQEYECQFLDSETAAFSYEDVQAALSEEVETWTIL